MKKYFLHNGNEQTGPFSIEELKNKNIQRDTPVWYEGLSEWTIANDLPEIKENLFATLPPVFKSKGSSEPVVEAYLPVQKKAFGAGRKFLVFGALVITIIVSFLIYANNKSSSSDTPSYPSTDIETNKKNVEELKQELADKEKDNPLEYLTGEVSLRNNLIGQKVITGHVSNTASIATFKDVELTVTFYSKTGTELGNEKLVVYEVIPPKGTSDFKFKTFAPGQTETTKVKVSDAKVAE